jgi:small subunit ribosomal protein S4
MAVYHAAKCRQCRRAGTKLFLKGGRCHSDKCAMERRAYAPGEHGKSRRIKETNYGTQLREKQKARRMYGVLERQFRNYFEEAERRTGITGEILLQLLERRLDNVVYRLGFASSRAQARLLVGQGHMLVNGHRASVPSHQVQVGDVVAVRDASRAIPPIAGAVSKAGGRRLPSWLQTEADAMSGRMIALPQRAEIDTQIQEELIVEFYSR